MAGALPKPYQGSSKATPLRPVLLSCLQFCAACVAARLCQTAAWGRWQVCWLWASTAAFEMLHDANAQQMHIAAAFLAVRLVQVSAHTSMISE